VFLALLGVLIQHSQNSVAQRNQDFESLETEHYRFVFNKNAAPYAEDLAGVADEMVQKMSVYLDAEAPPKIQTDLTANTSHIAGLAVHNRIRMRLRRVALDPENRFVLAHETAHVFQSSEARRRFKKVNSSVNFFIEGMAQHVAYHVEPDEKQQRINWVVGAVAADRHDIKFADMVDAEGFRERFDPELHYTLGDLWVNTMVEICGEDSLGKMLDIVGSDDAVLSLSGVAFWRQHLQRIPCELEDINFRFAERIKEINESDEAKAIPSTRSINVRADETDSNIVWLDVTVNNAFDVDADGIPIRGRDYLLRVKNGASLSRGLDITVDGYPQSADTPELVSYRLRRDQLSGNRFEYQIGYIGGFDYRSVFDVWQKAAIPRP